MKLAEDLVEVEENDTNLVISKMEEGDLRHLKKNIVIVLIEKHQRKHVQFEKSRFIIGCIYVTVHAKT